MGLSVADQNKPIERKVLTGGGIIVVLSISSYYLLLSTIVSISLATSLLISLAIGVYDDFRGIKKWKKVPVLLLSGVPFVIAYLVNGELWESTILFWNFGWIYWILIIPIVIAGFANGGNVLGGYDGMEVGIYLIISLFYIVVSFLSGNIMLFQLSLITAIPLGMMLVFNWAPSKMILGNSGSFAISSLLGIIPLIGHFEIVLPIVFAPHLVEVGLQIKYTRSHSYTVFGNVDNNGIVTNKYGKNMSIIHWIISWGNMTEKKITMAMLAMESILVIFAFFVWIVWYSFV